MLVRNICKSNAHTSFSSLTKVNIQIGLGAVHKKALSSLSAFNDRASYSE